MKMKLTSYATIFICISYVFIIILQPILTAELLLQPGVGVEDEYNEEVTRSDFPDGFLFGAASSSYQVEGAFMEDGKSLNNWDIFTHLQGRVPDGSTGDVATDHYHRYSNDIEMLHSFGADAYRFSISWSRILPRGRSGDVNPKGIAFYNRIINALLVKGIKPFVTIHHHDIPHILEAEFGSWLSPLMQDEFVTFAETCFKTFGDRVKHWVTINEPNLFAQFGYMSGRYPPGRCSVPLGNCSDGNSVTEPLIAMHNMLLAHAKAVKLYREVYQERQGGLVGIVGNFNTFEPVSTSIENIEAVNRAFAFNFGWMLDPLAFGSYPDEMRKIHGRNMPTFSPYEIQIVKGSLDFIGVNHYTTLYVTDCLHHPSSSSCSSSEASKANGYFKTGPTRNGIPIGEQTGYPRFCIVPRGMERVVEYLKDRYNNTPLFITENGYAGETEANIQDSLNDYKRVKYMRSYLVALARAIRNGADVRGYFVWSLMDSFEWVNGYNLKFGLYHVDFRTLTRTPKLSVKWYCKFLDGKHDRGQRLIQKLQDNNCTHRYQSEEPPKLK